MLVLCFSGAPQCTCPLSQGALQSQCRYVRSASSTCKQHAYTRVLPLLPLLLIPLIPPSSLLSFSASPPFPSPLSPLPPSPSLPFPLSPSPPPPHTHSIRVSLLDQQLCSGRGSCICGRCVCNQVSGSIVQRVKGERSHFATHPSSPSFNWTTRALPKL